MSGTEFVVLFFEIQEEWFWKCEVVRKVES